MVQKDNGNGHLTRFIAPVPGPHNDVPVQGEQPDDDPPNGAWRAARGRPEFGIDFETPDGTVEGFEYSGLVRRHFTAGKIELMFLADHMMKVTITGRGLKALHDLIRSHRCCLVRAVPRDMGQDELVVTAVSVEAVKEE